MNYIAFINYVAVMSITPGPNNLLLATAGVNFGFNRALPMSFGVSVGNSLQCFFALSTFHLLFQWLEELRFPMAVIGCTYLLWLSWKIYSSTSIDKSTRLDQPMGFWQMFFFQAINPKAWLSVVNVAVLFGSTQAHWSHHLWLALVNGLVVLPCVFIWAGMGARLKQWLQKPVRLQRFNLCMAVLMSLTAFWLLYDEAVLFMGYA